MSKFVVKTVNIVFSILCAIIVLVNILSFQGLVIDGIAGIFIDLGLLLIIPLILYYGEDIVDLMSNKVLSPIKKLPIKTMFFIIAAVTLLTKVFFVFLLGNDANLHPDMRAYLSFATQLAEKGCITEGTAYAFVNSYTMVYGLLLSPLVYIFGNSSAVTTVFLSVLFSVLSLLLFDIIRKYTGNVIAFVGVLLYNLLPMGMFQTQLLIHETALLFFHILALWLFLKFFENKYHIALRILFLMLSIIILSIGKSVNPSGIIIFISFGLYALSKQFLSGFSIKKLINVISICLVLVIAGIGSAQIAKALSYRIIEEKSEDTRVVNNILLNGIGFKMYLSMNYETSGAWNQEDMDTYLKYADFDNKDDAINYQKELIKGRLDEFIENPLIIPVHLFNKAKVLWGGCFLPFSYEQGNSINHFVLYGAGGIINKSLITLNYLSFILIYSMVLLSRKRLRNLNIKNEISPKLHFEMVIIGVTTALLFLEVMAKYVSNLHILLFAIWMMSLKDFKENSAWFKAKIRKIHNKSI